MVLPKVGRFKATQGHPPYNAIQLDTSESVILNKICLHRITQGACMLLNEGSYDDTIHPTDNKFGSRYGNEMYCGVIADSTAMGFKARHTTCRQMQSKWTVLL